MTSPTPSPTPTQIYTCPAVGTYHEGWTVAEHDTDRTTAGVPYLWATCERYGTLLFKMANTQFNTGAKRLGVMFKELEALQILYITSPGLPPIKCHNVKLPVALLQMPEAYRNAKTRAYLRSGKYVYPQVIPFGFMESLAGSGPAFRMTEFPNIQINGIEPMLKSDLDREDSAALQDQFAQARLFQVHKDAIARLEETIERLQREIESHRRQLHAMNEGVSGEDTIPSVQQVLSHAELVERHPSLQQAQEAEEEVPYFPPPSTDPNEFMVPEGVTLEEEPATVQEQPKQEPKSKPQPTELDFPFFDNEADGIVPKEDRDIAYYTKRVAFYAEWREKGNVITPEMETEEARCKGALLSAQQKKALYAQT